MSAEEKPNIPRFEAVSAAEDKRRSRAQIVFALLVVVLIVCGLYLYAALSRGRQSTDDAHIESRIAHMSSPATGILRKVAVAENSRVKAGDVLVELDDSEAQARIGSALTDMQAAEAELEQTLLKRQFAKVQTTSSRQQTRAEVLTARAGVELARAEYDRSIQLEKGGVSSESERQQKLGALRQAEAALGGARARANATNTRVDVTLGDDDATKMSPAAADAEAQARLSEAHLAQARAALKLRQTEASKLRIVAPISGVVTRLSSQEGQFVTAGTPLFAIVSSDDIWIEANFKETQLRHLRPGQKALVVLDAFPDALLSASVESTSAASLSRFALLRPSEVGGNFVKVTERLSVRLRFDEVPALPLSTGISASVTVLTLSP